MRTCLRFFTVCASLLAIAVASARADNDACFECHANPVFEKKMDLITREGYAAGVHADMDCTDCHDGEDETAFDRVPHRFSKVAITRCDICHRKDLKGIVDEYKASVHAERLPEVFACARCHDPHVMKLEKESLDSQTRRDRANAACLHCHRDADFRIAADHGDATPPSTTHDWLPSLEKHARMRCVVCHTPIEGDLDHQILPKEKATRSCDACHGENAPLVRKYVGEDDRSTWVTNPLVFEEAYLPGTVRHRLADGIILALFGLTLVGGLGHGLLRAATRRRKPAGSFDVVSTDMYPAGLRLWHWSNALLFLLLAITGLRMHFGGREDPILSFETAFNVHNMSGVVLVIGGILYFVMNAWTGNAGQYLRKPMDGMKGIVRQVRFYLFGIFRGEPHPYHSTPSRKFNPLQLVTYAGVMYALFPVLVLSGVVLLFPGAIPDRIGGKPGVFWVATIHYLSAAAGILFLLGHLYLATMGDRIGYLLSAMLTGRHRHHVPKKVEEEREAENPPPEQ